ncbi:phosphate signaling complex protein PhoU [Comamonadaceae bacterium OH2310_COT-174]|nr:phosphate signaling complex protein PhoU [Comamonadaceae bacterium OH2310_COT-174]
MPDQHSSSQFDAELKSISARIMEMGGLVEAQIKNAIDALSHFDMCAVDRIAFLEERVNALEVDIDADLSTIIATRQPTAKDLRMLLSISKATSNLERIGDESSKMGRMIKTLIDSSTPLNLPIMDLKYSGELAAAQLRRALDAFARHDVGDVVGILRQDDVIDREFEGYVRKLVTYMMEDPRKITLSMELLLLAKSIERIGDHSKNLAELIVFMVKGKDVRHTPVEQVQSALQ